MRLKMRLKVQEFKKDVILGVGRRIASYGKPVILAHDARKSSAWIAKGVSSGILEAGGTLIDAGLYPTPGVMYEAKVKGFNALVVTASHNPPEYNGFKALVDGLPVPREFIRAEDVRVQRDSVGKSVCYKITEYEKMLLKEAEGLEKERKVLIDYGHGVASLVSEAISKRVKHVSLFGVPDGSFPVRYPEPREDTLGIALKAFKGFDLGFAFDGDGDRCVVIDDQGRYVNDHVMLALYASYMAPKGPIITHVGASIIVNKLVEEEGGKVIRVRVGDPYLAKAAKEHNAAFAGEPNGARIHPDVHYFPDGPLTLLRILKMLEEIGEPLSKLVDIVPKTVVLREEVPRKRSYEEAMECVNSLDVDGIEIVRTDGIRVRVSEEERFLVRPSATEPVIRVRAEAKDESRAKELINIGKELARKCV